jgi:hypothetical protein
LKDLENDTAATQKAVDLDIAVGERHAKFSALEGDQQVKDYPNYVRDLKAIHQKMRDELPNDEVKRRFDARTLNTIGRTIFNGAGSAGTQAKKAADDASAARIQSIGNRVFQSPLDDVGFQQIQRDTEIEVRRFAALKGMHPDTMDDLLRKQWSLNIANRIEAVAKLNSEKGKTLFEENKHLLGTHADTVEKKVNAYRDVDVSRAAVVEEFEGADQGELAEKLPKSRDQYIEGAQRRARTAGGSPHAERLAEQEAGHRFDVNERRIRDQRQESNSKIGFWLNGGNTGSLPLNLQQLMEMSPEARDLYVNASPADQLRIWGALRANVRRDKEFTTESEQRWKQLYGMSSGTTAERNEFMDTDISAERHFPPAKANILIREQIRLRKDQALDPRIGQAMTRLKPWLDANNFNPNRDAETLQVFRGALQAGLNEWQSEEKNKGKKIPDEELQNLASDIILRQHKVPELESWYRPNWLIGGKQSTLQEMGVPEDAREIIINDPAFKNRGLDPDSTAGKLRIRELYIRSKFIELLRKKNTGKRRELAEEPEE